MRRMLLSLAALLALAACSGPPPAEQDQGHSSASLGLRYMQAGDDAGFAKALGPRPLVFPADHESHPDFRTEWWYFTGILEDAEASRYGFELTFFRVGLRPPGGSSRPSAWGTDQVWMAHLALTDTAGHRFIARERIARQALGLAGVSLEPLQLRVEGWTATLVAGDGNRWELAATADDVGLQLRLETGAPPVLNGNRGFDRKGGEPGNASYYYSLPRMTVTGTVVLEGRKRDVHGTAWMDREWSTSALDRETVGWDWFGLRLSDGGSLMYYRLRRADGTAGPFSSGTWVDGAGHRSELGPSDVELTPTDYWTSPVSGARYPVEWRLRVRSAGIMLRIEPYVADQELNVSVRYWEGAMHGSGTGPSGTLTAEGYLELAGY
jgi:predicted secreted hydrolase